MNYCDYYVKEVLEKPKYIKHIYSEGVYCYWNVKVSYYYDNGRLVTKDLTFNTEEEANTVKEGYAFLA